MHRASAILACCTSAVGLTMLIGCGRAHVSDTSIIRYLNDNESSLLQLRDMVAADSASQTISPNAFISKTESTNRFRESHIPQIRREAYRKRLVELNLDAVAGDARRVTFRYDPPSIKNGDSAKGLLYSQDPVSPVLDSLDQFKVSTGPQGDLTKTAYRRIRPNWYVYLSYD